MKKTLVIGLFILPFLISAQANLILKGTWTIDLRPSPDAEAYYQVFEVDSITATGFKGSFYGSPVENGLVNTQWEKLYFAFSTRDQNHSYYHSGYLSDGKLHGTSYCPGRNFTAPWTGVKE